MPLVPGVRLGAYEIVSLIGSGGMGEVYRARDTRLARDVALKVLPERLAVDPVFQERFEREARAASALNHPNICTIYDIGTMPAYLAMELLEGETLHDRLVRGALEERSVIDIAMALADALATAHQRGIIHRDIKPSNIFLATHGPKLVDFGLAKTGAGEDSAGVSQDATRTSHTLLTDPGTMVGTMAYMAPEQLLGEPVDARADLFSFGLVIYEMATGRHAFLGATRAAIAGAVLYQTPAAPRVIRPELSAHLEEITLRLLDKDRETRYQTARDVRADLKRLRKEAPADASPAIARASPAVDQPPPQSDIALVTHVAARHWRGLGVAAIAVVGAILGSIWLASRGQRSAPAETPRVVMLTTSGNASRPAISPDGRYVAFTRTDPKGDSLLVRQTATVSDVQIIAPEDGVGLWGSTVTPDGDFIDFVRRAQGRMFELWRVPLIGGGSRRIREGVTSPIGWSPDGRRFAFIRADVERGSTALVTANADGSDEQVVRERRRPSQFLSLMLNVRPSIRPAWSPNGRFIAIPGAGAVGGPRSGDIDVIEVSTRVEHQIPIPSASVKGLTWLNDSAMVLAIEDKVTDGTALSRLDYPSGRMTRLTNDPNNYEGIGTTSDRSTLVAERREHRTTVLVGDGAGQGMAEVARIDARGAGFAWAGQRMLYGANLMGRRSVWARNGASSQELIVGAISPTATSDGNTIVFVSSDAAKSGLWLADEDGRHLTQLVADDAAEPRITRDDRSVIFLSAREGQQSPWIVPIAGGTPTQIADIFVAAGGVDVGPDHRSITFMSRDRSNHTLLVVCQLPDCNTRRSWPTLGEHARWTSDGRGIAYIDSRDWKNIWVMPLDGTAPQPLTHFEDLTIATFEWSSDGGRLGLSREVQSNDIVLFKGLSTR